jgi:RNA polymerase sigma factor (sigma-70 family)
MSPLVQERYCPHLPTIPDCSDRVLHLHAFPLPPKVVAKFTIDSASSSARRSIQLEPCELLLDAISRSYKFLVESEAQFATRHAQEVLLGLEDATQEAEIALLRAANTYSPDHASKATFATYARLCIRRSLRDVARWMIRDRERAQLGGQLGVLLALRATHSDAVHLPQALPSSQNLTGVEDMALRNIYGKDAIEALMMLPVRERAIVWLTYVDSWSLRQISDYLDISRTRVHQLHMEALGKIRHYLARQRKRSAPAMG